MNNTESSMTGMRPKDAIKLDTSTRQNISGRKPYYVRMDFIGIFINPANNMETKKDEQQTLFGVKIRTD